MSITAALNEDSCPINHQVERGLDTVISTPFKPHQHSKLFQNSKSNIFDVLTFDETKCFFPHFFSFCRFFLDFHLSRIDPKMRSFFFLHFFANIQR